MKLILVKFGKVFSTLRRDGVCTGGKRVSSYFWMFLKNIFEFKSGDILIITGGVGDSAHYRAYNQAEELNLHGFAASVAIQDSPFLRGLVSKFSVFIFHRTVVTAKVKRMIEEIKNQKKEIIFETDDLVFDKKFIQETDYYKNKMTPFEKLQYSDGVGKEILADPYVKVATTTTTYLAKILESYGKKVFIVKNKISVHEEEVAENILKNIPRERDGFVRIGYFSGTASHNKDFATITEALLMVLEKYPRTELYLAGPLDMTKSEFIKFRKRIVILPLVSRDKYYENIWKVDINLAPLVLCDLFCESKSEIKFTEAGILGVPTVAIRNETFSGAIFEFQDGFLADSTQEWADKIGKLVVDEDLRDKMGEQARQKVLAEYTNSKSHSEEYYEYLRGIIKRSK